MEVGVNLAKFNIIQMQNLSFDFVTNDTLNYDTGFCRQFPRTHTCTYTHYNYLTALTQLSLLKQFIDNETTLNYYRCLSLCLSINYQNIETRAFANSQKLLNQTL